MEQALPNQRSPRQLHRSLVSAPPSGKSMKMRKSHTLTSVTTTLGSREHRNSDSTSSRTAADSTNDRQRSSGQRAGLAATSTG
jgi:hypothetical protein